MKKYEVVDPNIKIPPGHKCHTCENIMLDVFICSNACGYSYCKEHIPEDKKCEECEEELSYKEELSEKIKKKYQVKCLICDKEMLLDNFESHKRGECKMQCTQKCGIKLLEVEIEQHIENECLNTVISCLGCNKRDSRGAIKIHEELCESAIKNSKLLDSFRLQYAQQVKRIEKEKINQQKTLNDKINSLENQLSGMKEEIIKLKQNHKEEINILHDQLSSLQEENILLKKRVKKKQNFIC